MLILFVFAAFRGNGDVDYFNYKEYSLLFQNLNSVLFEHKFIEIGFRILSFFVNIINLDSQFVIIIMNLISISSVCFAIYKLSDDKMLSVVLFLPFYFQLDMHSSRTAVAASLGLLTFYFYYKEMFFKSLLTLLFAISFHKTAVIILIPLVFTNRKLLSFISDYFSIILIGLLWLFKNFVSLIELLVQVLKYLHFDVIAYKIESYASSQFGKPFSLVDPRLLLAFLIFISLVYLKNSKGFSNNIGKFLKLYNLVLAVAFTNILFYILFSDVTILAVRFSHYYNMITLISIPLMFSLLLEMRDNVFVAWIEKKVVLKKIIFVTMTATYIGYTLIVLPKVPYIFYSFF